MKTHTLHPAENHKIDAYWRAANYLSVGQITEVSKGSKDRFPQWTYCNDSPRR